RLLWLRHAAVTTLRRAAHSREASAFTVWMLNAAQRCTLRSLRARSLEQCARLSATRVLRSWLETTLELRAERERQQWSRAVMLRHQRRISRAALMWWNQQVAEVVRQAGLLSKAKRHAWWRLAWMAWFGWTEQRCVSRFETSRVAAMRVRWLRRRLTQLVWRWLEWAGEARVSRLAALKSVAHLRCFGMRLVVEAWRDFLDLQHQNRALICTTVARIHQVKVVAAWNQWGAVCDARQRQKGRGQRGLLRWQHGTQAKAYAQWCEWRAQQQRDSAVVLRALQRILRGMQSAALIGWAETAVERVRQRRLVERTLAGIHLRHVAMALRGWEEAVHELQVTRASAQRVAVMWTHAVQRMLREVVSFWVQWHLDRRVRRTLLARAAARIRHGATSAALQAWMCFAWQAAQVRQVAKRSLVRMQQGLAFAALDTWAEWLCLRRKARTALVRLRAMREAAALAGWRMCVQESQQERVMQQRMLTRWTQRTIALLRQMLEEWQAVWGASRVKTTQLRRAAGRMLLRLVSAAFARWSYHFLETRRARKVAMRVVLHFTGLALARPFAAWLTWAHDLAAKKICVRRMVLRWHSAHVAAAFHGWAEKLLARQEALHKVRCSARHWQCMRLGMALVTWQHSVRQTRRHKLVVRRCAARLLSNQLAQGFMGWHDEHQRRQQLRAAALATAGRWLNLQLALVLQRWHEFISSRAHARKMLLRLIHCQVAAAVHGWQAWAWEAHRLKTGAARVVRRCTHATLSQALGSWADRVAYARRRRAIVGRTLLRMKHRTADEALGAWVAWRTELRRLQVFSRHVVLRLRNMVLAAAVEAWAGHAAERARLRSLQKHIAMRIMHLYTRLALEGWRMDAALSVEERSLKMRICRRMSHLRCGLALQGWAELAAWARARRGVAERAMRLMASRRFRQAMNEWAEAAAWQRLSLQLERRAVWMMAKSRLRAVLFYWTAEAEARHVSTALETHARSAMLGFRARVALQAWWGEAAWLRARAAVAARARRVLTQRVRQAALLAWAHGAELLRARRRIAARAQRVMAEHNLCVALDLWSVVAANQRGQRTAAARTHRMVRERNLRAALDGWAEVAARCGVQLDVAQRGQARLLQSQQRRVLHGWALEAEWRDMRRDVAARARLRVEEHNLRVALHQWMEVVDAAHADDRTARWAQKVIARHSVSRAQAAWAEQVAAQQSRAAFGNWVVCTMAARMLKLWMRAWSHVATAQRSCRKLEARGLRRMGARQLAAWAEVTVHARWLRQRLLRLKLNMAHRIVVTAWVEWTVRCTERAADRAAQRWCDLRMLRWRMRMLVLTWDGAVRLRQVQQMVIRRTVARVAIRVFIMALNAWREWTRCMRYLRDMGGRMQLEWHRRHLLQVLLVWWDHARTNLQFNRLLLRVTTGKARCAFEGWAERTQHCLLRKLNVHAMRLKSCRQCKLRILEAWQGRTVDVAWCRAAQKRALARHWERLMTEGVTVWHGWARWTARTRRSVVTKRARAQLWVLFGVLAAWEERALQGRFMASVLRRIDQTRAHKIERHLFTYWWELTLSMCELRLKCQRIVEKNRLREQGRIFLSWAQITQRTLQQRRVAGKLVFYRGLRVQRWALEAWQALMERHEAARQVGWHATLHASSYVARVAMGNWRQFAANMGAGRELLGKVCTRLRNRQLAAALMGWWDHAHLQCRKRGVCRKVIMHFTNGLLAAAMTTFRYNIAWHREARMLLRRVILHARNRKLATGFARWQEQVQLAAITRLRIHRCLRRMQNNLLVAALAGWRANAGLSRRQRRQTANVLTRITLQSAVKAFSAWAGTTAECKAQRIRLRRFVLNMRAGQLAAMCQRWREVASRARVLRYKTVRAVDTSESRSLSATLHLWLEGARLLIAEREAEQLAEEMQLQSAHTYQRHAMEVWRARCRRSTRRRTVVYRALCRLQQRELAELFSTWLEACQQVTQRRVIIRRCIARQTKGGLAKAFFHWQDGTATSRGRHNNATRVRVRGSERAMAVAFDRWARWMTQRRSSAQVLESCRLRMMRIFASHCLHHWALYGQREVQARHRARRASNFMMNTAVARAFITWCAEWHHGRAVRRQEAVVGRMLQQLSSGLQGMALGAWVQHTATAKRLRRTLLRTFFRLQQAIFVQWAAMVALARGLRRSGAAIDRSRLRSMCSAALCGWLYASEMTRRMQRVKRMLDHRIQREALGQWWECMGFSQQHTMVVRQAQCMHMRRIGIGVLLTWLNASVLAPRRLLETLLHFRLRHMYQLLARVAAAWLHQALTNQHALECKAAAFARMRSGATCPAAAVPTFRRWCRFVPNSVARRGRRMQAESHCRRRCIREALLSYADIALRKQQQRRFVARMRGSTQTRLTMAALAELGRHAAECAAQRRFIQRVQACSAARLLGATLEELREHAEVCVRQRHFIGRVRNGAARRLLAAMLEELRERAAVAVQQRWLAHRAQARRWVHLQGSVLRELGWRAKRSAWLLSVDKRRHQVARTRMMAASLAEWTRLVDEAWVPLAAVSIRLCLSKTRRYMRRWHGVTMRLKAARTEAVKLSEEVHKEVQRALQERGLRALRWFARLRGALRFEAWHVFMGWQQRWRAARRQRLLLSRHRMLLDWHSQARTFTLWFQWLVRTRHKLVVQKNVNVGCNWRLAKKALGAWRGWCEDHVTKTRRSTVVMGRADRLLCLRALRAWLEETIERRKFRRNTKTGLTRYAVALRNKALRGWLARTERARDNALLLRGVPRRALLRWAAAACRAWAGVMRTERASRYSARCMAKRHRHRVQFSLLAEWGLRSRQQVRDRQIQRHRELRFVTRVFERVLDAWESAVAQARARQRRLASLQERGAQRTLGLFATAWLQWTQCETRLRRLQERFRARAADRVVASVAAAWLDFTHAIKQLAAAAERRVRRLSAVNAQRLLRGLVRVWQERAKWRKSSRAYAVSANIRRELRTLGVSARGWAAHAQRAKAVRVFHAHSVQRAEIKLMGLGFLVWKSLSSSVRLHQRLERGLGRRARERLLKGIFYEWAEASAEGAAQRVAQRGCSRRVLQWQRRRLLLTWAELCAEGILRDEALKRGRRRLQRRRLSQTARAWHRATGTARWRRAQAYRVVVRRAQVVVGVVLRAWQFEAQWGQSQGRVQLRNVGMLHRLQLRTLMEAWQNLVCCDQLLTRRLRSMRALRQQAGLRQVCRSWGEEAHRCRCRRVLKRRVCVRRTLTLQRRLLSRWGDHVYELRLLRAQLAALLRHRRLRLLCWGWEEWFAKLAWRHQARRWERRFHLRRWRGLGLLAVREWRALTALRLSQRIDLRLLAARKLVRQATSMFRSWASELLRNQDMVGRTQLAMHRAVQYRVRRCLTACFASWMELTTEQQRLNSLLKRGKMRLGDLLLTSTFAAWKAWAKRRIQDVMSHSSTVVRWRTRMQYMVYAEWLEVTITRRIFYQLLLRASQRRERRLLSAAYLTWLEGMVTQFSRKQAIDRLLIRQDHRLLFVVMATWLAWASTQRWKARLAGRAWALVANRRLMLLTQAWRRTSARQALTAVAYAAPAVYAPQRLAGLARMYAPCCL
ncbi:hypothetical protein CYMTET_22687, partial [Cymbomonas tetramitiformis]